MQAIAFVYFTSYPKLPRRFRRSNYPAAQNFTVTGIHNFNLELSHWVANEPRTWMKKLINPFDDDQYSRVSKNDTVQQKQLLASIDIVTNSNSTFQDRNSNSNRNVTISNETDADEIYSYDKLGDNNQIIRCLVDGRVYGLPNTNGTILSNYCVYVLNNHPLLSIGCSHSLNPYSKYSRLIVQVCTLLFSLFVSFLLLRNFYMIPYNTCEMGCNSSGVGNDSDTCSGGENDGLNINAYKNACNYYTPWVLTAIAGIIIMIYSSFLKFVVTCGCMQGREFFELNCLGKRFKQMTECIGGKVITFFLVTSVIEFAWAMYECYYYNIETDILRATVISKALASGYWFIYTIPYFAVRYLWDKATFESMIKKRNKSKLSIQMV